jgi:hypothetical protein
MLPDRHLTDTNQRDISCRKPYLEVVGDPHDPKNGSDNIDTEK